MVCRAIRCERLKNINRRLSRYYKNARFSRISPHDGRRRKIRQSRADLTFKKVSVCGYALHYSNYQQVYVLPDDIEREKISAKVDNGVLVVTLPKMTKQEAKDSKRQIEIA